MQETMNRKNKRLDLFQNEAELKKNLPLINPDARFVLTERCNAVRTVPPSLHYPLFSVLFGSFCCDRDNIRINLLCINTLKVIFNYFGDVRVFLKITGNRNGPMNNDQ